MRKVGIAVVIAMVALGVVAGVSCFSAPAERAIEREGQQPVQLIPGDDLEMNQAIAQAQATLDSFTAQLDSPKPDQLYFSVKVRLQEGEAIEHVWLDEPVITGSIVRGYLGNEPVDLEGYTLGQEITTTRALVSDWMYVQDNVLMGGFTIRVTRDRMTPEERQEFDQSLGLVIE